MKKKLSLETLEVRSFRTSTTRDLRGGADTVYYTCREGCSHGPDCIDPGTGTGNTIFPCEQ